ncbi:MAG: isopentenyl-diphosphate Delta-isomerase [Pseudomonadota bacterium]
MSDGAAEIPAWVDGRLCPVEKLEVHRRGLCHPAISVFVMRDGETLLQRRAASKYHTPGLWTNACCTHPHWGEDLATAATRRLGEELGITDLPLSPRGEVEYRADVGGGLTEHERVALFTAEAPEALPLSPDPAEVGETRWCPLPRLVEEIAEAPGRFTPWLRIYLAEHRATIFEPA